MKKVFFLLMAVCLMSCGATGNDTEKFQTQRNKVVNVHDRVQAFDPGDFLFSRVAVLTVMGDYLVIQDSRNQEKLYHLYDRNSLRFLCSTGDKGQGPSELSGPWTPMYDRQRHKFYAVDPNYKKVFSFDIDSMMQNPDYLPVVKQEFVTSDEARSLLPKFYVNDTLTYGQVTEFYTDSRYRLVAMKWNMQTGQLWLNEHHQGRRTYGYVAYSQWHKLVVESDGAYDLLTLLDDELNLKCYVKGPKWNEKRDNLHHFGAVAIYGDYILALYDGTLWNEANSPRICHVFDLEGNYVKTLDFDYNVHTISIDEEKARMYVSMDDVIQFGYLDLKGILD